MAALAMTNNDPRIEALARGRETLADRRVAFDGLRKAGSKSEALKRCVDLLLACDPAVDGVSLLTLLRQCRGVTAAGARRLLDLALVPDHDSAIGDTRIHVAHRLAATLRDEAARLDASRRRHGR